MELDRALTGRLDEIWSPWRRDHSPEEVDGIAHESLLRIRQKLKDLTQYLVVIAVPFSSKRRQDELGEAMREKCLHLIPLYQKATPPFWTN